MGPRNRQREPENRKEEEPSARKRDDSLFSMKVLPKNKLWLWGKRTGERSKMAIQSKTRGDAGPGAPFGCFGTQREETERIV